MAVFDILPAHILRLLEVVEGPIVTAKQQLIVAEKHGAGCQRTAKVRFGQFLAGCGLREPNHAADRRQYVLAVKLQRATGQSTVRQVALPIELFVGTKAEQLLVRGQKDVIANSGRPPSTLLA